MTARADPEHRMAVFRRPTPGSRARHSPVVQPELWSAPSRRRRYRMSNASKADGRGRLAPRRRAGGVRRRERRAGCALAVSSASRWRRRRVSLTSPSPCRGSETAPHLFGSDALKKAICGVAKEAHRGVRDLGDGAARTSAPCSGRPSRRRRLRARCENVDLERRQSPIIVVFAKLEEGKPARDGERRYIALVVDADDAGLRVTERIDVSAPHPLGTVRFDGCRVPGTHVVGEAGAGLRVALATLDLFRPTVGAAALGLARRAMEEACGWVGEREVFGRPLAEHQMTQARLAEMACSSTPSRCWCSALPGRET